MTGKLHILKLSVGTESIDDLIDWQKRRSGQIAKGKYYHVTRMWPKREAEIVDGGSIYWVIKGVILCRQRILGMDEIVRQDGIRRCGLVLDPEITRVAATPKKAFQGWRYLEARDAPEDLPAHRQQEDQLPPDLSKALAMIGVR